MARRFGTGGGGRGLFVVRSVIIVGCVLRAGVFAVVLLLGLVSRKPTVEEAMETIRDETLRSARCKP